MAKSKSRLEQEISAVQGRDPEVTIVVAWTEDVRDLAPGQKPWRHDLGERPKWIDVKKPQAAMWLNRGSSLDVQKAQAYIQREHPSVGRVFTYPTHEKDPLGKARRDILR